MLRAVLSNVEVVRSSSSNLREPTVACGQPFEFACGDSAAAVQSVVGARPKVERGVLPSVSRGCLSAKVDRAGVGFEDRSSGASKLSTPAKVRGLRASWPNAEVACEQSPSRKPAKAKSRPTRRLQADAYVIINSSGLRLLATSRTHGGL